MEVGEHVHLFSTSACNLNCSYCFGPDTQYKAAPGGLPAIAETLAANGVKMVTLGGGEPLLAKDLDTALKILKEAGIYISLHTNGTLLTDSRISQLSDLVDDIGLPLDTLDEERQVALRGKKFRQTFRRIFDTADQIREVGMEVGWHTVFTSQNYREMPKIYRRLEKSGFKYWRVYEFNYDLARARFFRQAKSTGRKSQSNLIKKWGLIQSLNTYGTPEKGYADCLLAHFLLTEEKMKKQKNPRIQFVYVHAWEENKKPYMFIEPSGDVSSYSYFSQYERRKIGNLFRDGFEPVKRQMKEVYEKGPDPDDETMDEWVETQIVGTPLWQRLIDGAFSSEELEEIKGRRNWEAFADIAVIQAKREARYLGVSEREAIEMLPF